MANDSNGEFDLIRRFFHSDVQRSDVALGIGDDCALLEVPAGHQLAVSMDTLVEGTHFLFSDDPFGVGHKSLAVNLSDLAAMGVKPAWATLALSLPDNGPEYMAWLAGFAAGFFALAEQYQLALVGGDTTRGPLAITIQVHGHVRADQALLRSGAKPGDRIFVSGPLGDAALALRIREDVDLDPRYHDEIEIRLHRPQPRVELGLALSDYASACIDISDGFAADLSHILERSHVGARICQADLPMSMAMNAYIQQSGDYSLLWSGGEAYELCFCIPESKVAAASAVLEQYACRQVGVIEPESGLRAVLADGQQRVISAAGYDHFS